MQPIRIQRKRIKGWAKPENTINITRPGKWGNPFPVGKYLNAWGKAFVATIISKEPDNIREIYNSGILEQRITLEKSLEWFELYLNSEYFKYNIEDLRGRNLMCFCPLDHKCHGDIYFKKLYGCK